MSVAPFLTLGNGSQYVVCLHGWFGTAEHWGPMFHHLDLEHFTWVFPEYPGYGTRLNEGGGEMTLESIAGEILDVIASLPDGQVDLLGHSMAGMFVQKVLAEAPDGRIGRLVGITPVPGSGTPLEGEALALFESAGSEASSRRAIIDMTTGNRLPSRWLDATVEASLENSTPQAIDQAFHVWAYSDVSERVRGRENPFLVLYGEHDVAITKQTVEGSYGQFFPNSEIRRLRNSGHYPMDEIPLDLVAQVETFLRR